MNPKKAEKKIKTNPILGEIATMFSDMKMMMLIKDMNNIILYMNEVFKKTFSDDYNIEEIKQKILSQVIIGEEYYYKWQFCNVYNEEYCCIIVPQFFHGNNIKTLEVILMIANKDFKNVLPKYGILKDNENYLSSILECISACIFITDNKGNVIESNNPALGPYDRKDIIDKNMKDLIAKGIYEDSVALEAIEKEKPVNMVQRIYGKYYLSTAIPYFQNGEIKQVVVCGYEIDKMETLKKQLLECKKKNDAYKRELEYMRSSIIKDMGIIAETPEMKQVIKLALKSAKFELRTLIEGETGVGKGIIAKLIYRNSPRHDKPFIPINCGAIPETLLESELYGYEKGAFTGASSEGKKGFFELANHGILFLDEIGEVSQNFQVKLLRAIEENEIMRVGGNKPIPIDVQIIAATNKNLLEKVNNGEFRADLYYRLNSFPIHIPPLRERQEDIVPLINLFTKKFNEKYSFHKEFSSSALSLLKSYQWPGNIRELENIVERLILVSHGSIITDTDVVPLISNPELIENQDELADLPLDEVVKMFERQILLKYFEKYEDTGEIAEALKISRSTVNRKLKAYNIR